MKPLKSLGPTQQRQTAASNPNSCPVVESKESSSQRTREGRRRRSLEKHAVQKLVWLRETDRRRSKGELLKALMHQRIHIERSAVHYVAPPRNTNHADARNSVFKLNQQYRLLPDSEQMISIHQMFSQIKEDDSGDEDDVFASSFRGIPQKSTEKVKKGEKQESEKVRVDGGDARRTNREGESGRAVEGAKGVEKKSSSNVNVRETAKREDTEAVGHGRAVEGKNSDSKAAAAAGGECALCGAPGVGGAASARWVAEEIVHIDEKRQSELEKWLEVHPLTPDDIFEVFSAFGKELGPAMTEGAVSVETLEDDGIADSFTKLAVEEVLGGVGEGPAGKQEQQQQAVAGSIDSNSGATKSSSNKAPPQQEQGNRDRQRDTKKTQGSHREAKKAGDEEEDETTGCVPGVPCKMRAAAEEPRFLKPAEVEALNTLQRAFVSNSLYTWFEDVRKAYAFGSKLIRVNALGYKFIRNVRVTAVLLTMEPIRKATKRTRWRIPISSIQEVRLGKRSREFDAIIERIKAHGETESNNPPATSCAVLDLPNDRTLSLIFLDEFHRNSFAFFIRVLVQRISMAEKHLPG